MGKTSIEWTDETWNPVVGCTRVSPGCKNCYAFTLHDMRHEAHKNGSKVPEQYAKPFTEIQLMPDRLMTPLKRRKPSMWFVNSVSDMFHKDVPFEFIDRCFAVMAMAERHTFQVLTKRPERAAEYLRDQRIAHVVTAYNGREFDRYRDDSRNGIPWPLPNVWIGTSVEDQKRADERIPHLLKIPAAVRFLSCEPLLGPVDLSAYFPPMDFDSWQDRGEGLPYPFNGPDWVIVGGESGRGSRECHLKWIRSIVYQCQDAGASVFVKQLGAKPIENDRWDCYATEPEQVVDGLKIGVRDRVVMTMGGGEDCDYPLFLKDSHGGDMAEWPEDLRVREFPESAARLTGG